MEVDEDFKLEVEAKIEKDVLLAIKKRYFNDEEVLVKLTNNSAENEKKLQELEEKHKDAVANLGDAEVKDCLLEIVNHFYNIGDKDTCLAKIQELIDNKKLFSVGPRLDLVFMRIRLGLAFDDSALTKENIALCHEILKTESDWERRNRLKVFEGLYSLTTRNWARSCELFLDCIATFSAYELLDYDEFVYLMVFVAIAKLPRPELKSKIIDNPELITVFPKVPKVVRLLRAIYNCKYDEVFDALEAVCEQMQTDMWLSKHVNYYFREVRVLAFRQFLASYRSVAINKMAAEFKLTVQHLEEQLCRFITANRLDCKIDKVAGQVVTEKQESRNVQYLELVKQGDIVLNKVQRLSRVIGV